MMRDDLHNSKDESRYSFFLNKKSKSHGFRGFGSIFLINVPRGLTSLIISNHPNQLRTGSTFV